MSLGNNPRLKSSGCTFAPHQENRSVSSQFRHKLLIIDFKTTLVFFLCLILPGPWVWTYHPDLSVPVLLAEYDFFVCYSLLRGASWLYIAVFVVSIVVPWQIWSCLLVVGFVLATFCHMCSIVIITKKPIFSFSHKTPAALLRQRTHFCSLFELQQDCTSIMIATSKQACCDCATLETHFVYKTESRVWHIDVSSTGKQYLTASVSVSREQTK